MVARTGVDLSGIQIGRSGSTTIYQQLCDQLREMIQRGVLPVATRMPSTRAFAAELGVSRITAREVYDQLVAEGYLRAVVGSGTFVSEHTRAIESLGRQAGVPHSRAAFSRPRTTPILSQRAVNLLSIPPGEIAARSHPFNPALPDFSLFPFHKWNRIVKRSLLSHDHAAMDYGQTSGYLPLRESIASNLRLSRGVNCDADQVVIVASSEQAIRRLAFLLLDQRDSVWFGEPGVYSRRNAFRATGSVTHTVSVDDEGVLVSEAYQFDRARLAYVMPWRHYPLGITMSLARRLQLLQWAQQKDAWIIEDDFGSEFSFVGKAPPPIQSLDDDGRVIYLGGFGLTLFPALRLSYMVVPDSLIEASRRIAHLERAESATLQPALAEFLSEGHLTAHIRKMRKVYHRREKFLAGHLNDALGDAVSISGRGGATNIVLTPAARVDSNALRDCLNQQGVIAYSLCDYYLSEGAQTASANALILGFACASRTQLEKSADTLISAYRLLETAAK